MKSESFLHTCVVICNFVCEENHILFKHVLSIIGTRFETFMILLTSAITTQNV